MFKSGRGLYPGESAYTGSASGGSASRGSLHPGGLPTREGLHPGGSAYRGVCLQWGLHPGGSASRGRADLPSPPNQKAGGTHPSAILFCTCIHNVNITSRFQQYTNSTFTKPCFFQKDLSMEITHVSQQ